jgi:hypothetical protein
MKVLDNNDPITLNYLSKIGEVIVTLNYLESLVELAIWEMLGEIGKTADLQGVGRRITYSLEFVQKVDLLRSLIVEIYGEERAKNFKVPIRH